MPSGNRLARGIHHDTERREREVDRDVTLAYSHRPHAWRCPRRDGRSRWRSEFSGLGLLLLCASCAGTPRSADDAKPTAGAEKLAGLELCKSTFDDAKIALGVPYRDGRAHTLRVVTWKIAPIGHRKGEPAAIAFRGDGVAVDWCYDTPGIVRCELGDRCSR